MNLRTICEIAGNPARDIIEGRTKIAPVATVPWRQFAANPAPDDDVTVPMALSVQVRPLLAPEPKKPVGRPRGRNGNQLRDLITIYRATNPGPFTTDELINFVCCAGYKSRTTDTNIATMLRRMYIRNEVRESGREDRHIIWEFI
jgi:hypothetical protein